MSAFPTHDAGHERLSSEQFVLALPLLSRDIHTCSTEKHREMFSGNTDFDAQPLLSDGGLLMALYCTNLQVHLVAAMSFDTKLVSIGYIISNKLPPDTTQLLL